MSKSKWTGAVSSDWADPDDWSPAGVPGADSDVVITSGAPVASASIGTVNSITDSSELSFDSAGTNTVTTFVDDAGRLRVDADAGAGGTTLNIGGGLNLNNHGHVRIGNASLSAPTEVRAASISNSVNGSIRLIGSKTNQALLDVTARYPMREELRSKRDRNSRLPARWSTTACLGSFTTPRSSRGRSAARGTSIS
jgi:hypothetical protein